MKVRFIYLILSDLCKKINYMFISEGCPNRWTFHPAALVAVVWYRRGDIVRMTNSATQARVLQRQHGEWVPAMEEVYYLIHFNYCFNITCY